LAGLALQRRLQGKRGLAPAPTFWHEHQLRRTLKWRRQLLHWNGMSRLDRQNY
jgi:hypothetical protein